MFIVLLVFNTLNLFGHVFACPPGFLSSSESQDINCENFIPFSNVFSPEAGWLACAYACHNYPEKETK